MKTIRRHSLSAVAVASFVFLQSAASNAQPINRIEAIPIQTTSSTTEQFLNGDDRLKKAGADVVLTEYPGAFHSYDSFALTKPISFPQAQTTRHCTVREVGGGQLVNAKTGKKFDLNDPCVERGTQVAYNAAAHEATLRAVKEFLTTKVTER